MIIEAYGDGASGNWDVDVEVQIPLVLVVLHLAGRGTKTSTGIFQVLMAAGEGPNKKSGDVSAAVSADRPNILTSCPGASEGLDPSVTQPPRLRLVLEF